MFRLSSMLVFAAALAAGPTWADNEQHGKKEKHSGDDRMNVEVHFGEAQHAAVRGWYEAQIREGHCPPGLAKKHNGCMPPGQAKKRWAIGRPLPSDLIFHDLPPPLLVELGPPLPGYRYARVANDVLLLSIGSGMVVDAITDLGGR